LPVDAVEVAFDVDIEHPVVSPAPLTSRPDCVDGRATWTISVGVAMKDGLQDRLQIALDHFLGDAVGDRRNSERPFPRPSGSSPVGPAEENSSRRTSGSTTYRGCLTGQPQSRQLSVRRLQPLPGSPSLS